VGGFVQKYVVVKLQVLIRWPIQHGVNYLIKKKVEEGGFLFNLNAITTLGIYLEASLLL